MKYIIYIASIFAVISVSGQDRSVLYSQYLYNKLAVNPAFTGGNDVFTVSLSTEPVDRTRRCPCSQTLAHMFL